MVEKRSRNGREIVWKTVSRNKWSRNGEMFKKWPRIGRDINGGLMVENGRKIFEIKMVEKLLKKSREMVEK